MAAKKISAARDAARRHNMTITMIATAIYTAETALDCVVEARKVSDLVNDGDVRAAQVFVDRLKSLQRDLRRKRDA